MRINKYIASSGLVSRRKADELIINGNVKVNNMTLTEPGYDVKEGDIIEVNGARIQAEEKKYYIMLNKPVGYITSLKDEKGRPTVIDLVNDVDARIFPVGRLDYNTSGLLIMTNDGDFSYRVSHPKHHMGKTYRVKAQGIISKEKLAKLKKGIDIGGYITSKAEAKIIKELPRQTVIEITIYEGKNRQVRKMFKAIGNPVVELERIAVGDVKLGRLATGGYRNLAPGEIKSLTGEKTSK